MKRVGNLYEGMVSIELIEKAYAGVMKDKHQKTTPGSIAFMIRMNKDYYIAEVGRILSERAFKPAKPRCSKRIDRGSGKIRDIQAPRIFPDQFVHWAIILQLQPILSKGMDDWCCASVKGRGTLYAKNFIEKKLDNSNNENRKIPVERQYKYCLKMDIRKFFQNINKDILMQKLERKVKDKEMLKICSDIIYSTYGTGIPLGYYTSQWFANFYLQDFDHNLREKLMPKYGVDTYLRYMDDMIILGSNKRKLNQLMKEIQNYLMSELGLELKNTSCVFDISEREIDFIGFKFSYGKTTLRKSILHNIKLANGELYKGKFTLKQLRVAGAYNGWLKHSNTKEFQEEHLQGTRELELHKLSEYARRDTMEYYSSKKYAHSVQVEKDILDLRNETQNPDDHVLIRYYPDTDEIRVVARTKFEFPDEKAYRARLEAEKKAKETNKKKKRRKHRPGTPYYPSAEIYYGPEGSKGRCIRDYNAEIYQYDEMMATV